MTEQFNDQLAKPTIHGSSLFGSYKIQAKRVRNQGPRQQLIARIAYDLGIPSQYLSGIYFQANGIVTDDELIALRDRAMTFRANPAALFRKLLKEKREEIKSSLMTASKHQPDTQSTH